MQRVALGAVLSLGLLAGCGDSTDDHVVVADAASDARPHDVPAVTVLHDGATVRDVPAVVDVATDRGVVVADLGDPALDAGDLTPDLLPDGGAPGADAEPTTTPMGATMRVTASTLNLRSGVGTTNPVLTTMPCGARVTVLDGPTTGWWHVQYGSTTGWASGTYLVADAAFDPSVCGGAVDAGTPAVDAGTTTSPTEVTHILDLARSAVGYSYYWGHGSWRTDGASHGSCAGSCPSCTHNGAYGADCSGFVAKVWQVPSPSPVSTDLHPYSTYNFFNQTTHWRVVDRSAIRAADALVYNSAGEGHIMRCESGADPWGSIWTFEARGCATGIVHNLRTAGTAYITLRREGL